MHVNPILPLGLLSLLLAAPAQGASGVSTPDYRPLAGAAQLKRGETLKPRSSNFELPPIVLETRVHYHADGSARYECQQSHGEDKRAVTPKQEDRR
jgi:hypothetical protein